MARPKFNEVMEEQLSELRSLAAHAQNRRTETGIPRVAMVQGAVPEHELAAVYEPMVNLILQGSKSMTVGDQTLHYDPATYFVMSVDLPAAGIVRGSETGAPYLAVSLTLDPTLIRSLLSDLPAACLVNDRATGFSVAAVTANLLDAWVRMLRLMGHPSDIAALAPAYEREILFRVLQGPVGWMLRDIAIPDTGLSRMTRVIHRIRRDYAQSMRMEELADEAAMSVSAFHRRFKAVTTLSPLQYQKQIRLLQARTRLIATGCSVTMAAHEVGYESATHFSRDYTRAFGLPPAQDTARIVAGLKADLRG